MAAAEEVLRGRDADVLLVTVDIGGPGRGLERTGIRGRGIDQDRRRAVGQDLVAACRVRDHGNDAVVGPGVASTDDEVGSVAEFQMELPGTVRATVVQDPLEDLAVLELV